MEIIKTPEELRYALDNKIGTIVIDNFYEIDLLEELLATRNQTQKFFSGESWRGCRNT